MLPVTCKFPWLFVCIFPVCALHREGLESASIYVSVFEGMDAKLRCPFDTSKGSTTKDGEFMWSNEAENGIWQPVAIRKRSTLQQSFRKKIYDEDLGKGTLSSNKTVNGKFHGRVNISEVGTLILMNSTVNDSGYFQCKFKGYTDIGLPRESVVHLSVEPFQVQSPTTESQSNGPSGVASPTATPNAKSSAPSRGYFLATGMVHLVLLVLAL